MKLFFLNLQSVLHFLRVSKEDLCITNFADIINCGATFIDDDNGITFIITAVKMDKKKGTITFMNGNLKAILDFNNYKEDDRRNVVIYKSIG
jgi:hypothetical protein